MQNKTATQLMIEYGEKAAKVLYRYETEGDPCYQAQYWKLSALAWLWYEISVRSTIL